MKLDFGKLGFDFLRLPHLDPNDISDVDLETTKQMVDLFLERGFRYFDTAYTYLNGKSEVFLRKALVERYPRDSYMIATKLPCSILAKGKTAEEVFREQLERCGVDFFDVYLLHGLDAEDADYAEKQGCFDFLQEQKKKGKVRYTGFSFHGSAPRLIEEGLGAYASPESILRVEVLLLRHIGHAAAAAKLEKAMDGCEVRVTGDKAGATCEAYANALLEML